MLLQLCHTPGRSSFSRAHGSVADGFYNLEAAAAAAVRVAGVGGDRARARVHVVMNVRTVPFVCTQRAARSHLAAPLERMTEHNINKWER